MRKLVIVTEFDSGEKTCWNPETEKWCPHAYTSQFGFVWRCAVFEKLLCDENGEPSGPGLLQRLPECLAHEVK